MVEALSRVEFQRFKRPMVFSVGERGEQRREFVVDKRNTPISIGIGEDGDIIICYPQKNSRLQGYHLDLEETIPALFLRQTGRKEKTLLNGSVKTERQEDGSQKRVLTIYGRHPEDIDELGGIRSIREMLTREGKESLIGTFIPEPSLSEDVAENLKSSTQSDELRVGCNKSSRMLYAIK